MIMNRRNLIKSIGLASVATIGGAGLLSSCVNEAAKKEDAAIKGEDPKAVEEKPLSEKEKKIINRQKMDFADPENPTDHELKHTPEITILDKDPNGFSKIKITLGQQNIIHPTTPDHWIDYLTIYVDGEKAAHTEYEPGTIRGYAEFFVDLKDKSKITAEAGCNLHGIWSNSVEIG
jgi:desulfoferrodoxin-like iron-binding protein